MKKGLSKYKFKKIAKESLVNAIRLHGDSILLFNNRSFPTSFHISVLAMEEFCKAKWIDHYFDASVTNEGFPDTDFEQEFLKLLHKHLRKQNWFVGRQYFEYSPKFLKFIKDGLLEVSKQKSIYVGLERIKGKIDTTSRISVPNMVINEKKAKQIISLLNYEFLEVWELIEKNEYYWFIDELYDVVSPDNYSCIFEWPYKTGLKSRKWIKVNQQLTSGST